MKPLSKTRDRMRAGVMESIYQPTASQKEECARLLAALRLPADVCRRYRRDAAEYLDIFSRAGKARRVSSGMPKFAMRRSALFGREYLVAYADAAWLLERAPGNNAFATASVWLGPIESPPLVLLPECKEQCQDPAFLSILEHEIVHVHQFLLGTCPDAQPDTAEGWLRDIFGFARAEYEANMIQLVRWPALYEPIRAVYDIPLEEHCALRGYTLGLERAFLAMAAGNLAETELVEFLERLPAALPSGFRRIGLDERLGMKFAGVLPGHVSVTLHILAKFAPGLRHSLRPPALMSWLRGRPGLGESFNDPDPASYNL